MKKIRAFSLIEILVAIMLLSMIALFIFPSAYKNLEESKKVKDMAMISFALQEAIEEARIDQLSSIKNINSYLINIDVSPHENDPEMVRIKASYENYEMILIEEKK